MATFSQPRTAVTIVFNHQGNQPTGVTGLPGAEKQATALRYESSVTVSGGLRIRTARETSYQSMTEPSVTVADGLTGHFKGSIYPDNMNVSGRVKDGEYNVYLGFHNPGVPTKKDLVVRTNKFRAVLIVNSNQDVPVTSNNLEKTTSNAIHIHNGYNSWWPPNKPMSEGCLILAPADWPAFLQLFLGTFLDLADWSVGGGRLGKKIGTVVVKGRTNPSLPSHCQASSWM